MADHKLPILFINNLQLIRKRLFYIKNVHFTIRNSITHKIIITQRKFNNSTILAFHISEDGKFVDDDNAIRVFHGFNVVYKPPPYFPITDHFDVMTSFSKEDCELLVSLGFNVIRLHVAFEAGMPQRGILNDEYILHIRDIVRLAAQYNIYVILDAHQDLLNRQFCGEGFPDWAVTKTDFPSPQNIELRLDDQGYPLIEDCLKQDNFAKFYLTSDVGRNVESILKNENGVADMFGLFWKRVAELNKDEWNVLGYEILNEPTSGNYQKDKLSFFWPGWANQHLIMPFYQMINSFKVKQPHFKRGMVNFFLQNQNIILKNQQRSKGHQVTCGISIKIQRHPPLYKAS